MPGMIPNRDVAERLYRQLQSRAALAGLSRFGYLLNELRWLAGQPNVAELRARLALRSPVDPAVRPAEAVRAERDRL